MGKTVLITGTSAGIGRSTAKLFQEKGWNVAATMRKPDEDGKELSELENVEVSRLDVTDSESIKSAVAGAIERFGKIDALVNNAGYGLVGPVEAIPMETIAKQFNTNVIGLIETTKAVLPHFRANKDGTIVNVSSVGGKMTFPLVSLYHGTKFAVEGVSESMAYEMSAIGVKVKIVEPGAIATDFSGRSMEFINDEGLEEYQGLVASVNNAFGSIAVNSSDPGMVAEVIYEAVTDGTDQLRYLAGEDAKEYVANREKASDAEFFAGIKEIFMS